MNELASLISDEIRRGGPMLFSRFMDLALYHPHLGYYRREHDPFGRTGDFYTAEQLQPVFGRLISSYLRRLARDLGDPRPLVVEVGAGRREMADAFTDFDYVPVELHGGSLPESFSGIVFTNEFFDALPVDLLVRRNGETFEKRVALHGGRFAWDESRGSGHSIEEGLHVRETQQHRLAWLTRIADRLGRGFVVTIDYGYTAAELVRFPEGTLMSYRRHVASPDVLACPGEQDITAHVDFNALERGGADVGLRFVELRSLASMLLAAGEGDQFKSALAGRSPVEEARNRRQLKTLLFGMGESFHVLIQQKSM